jgi:hypothetical protein
MKIQSCKFVSCSDLFKDLDELWEDFSSSDPEFTWGSANRTLIDPLTIIGHMNNVGLDDRLQFKTLCKRINELPRSVYVDMES